MRNAFGGVSETGKGLEFIASIASRVKRHKAPAFAKNAKGWATRDTLCAGVVRMSDKKAVWLATNFDKIRTMGGPAEVKTKMLAQPGRDAKIAFLESFDGIGPKYARNIFMNVYHPEFRQSVAVDSRIDSVLESWVCRA